MIQLFYKTPKTKLVSLDDFKPHSWVMVEAPTEGELERISSDFNLEKGLLQDALDIDEVPRYEIEGGNLYVFTRYVFGTGENVDTTPMLIILTHNSLVTLSVQPFPRMSRFIDGKVTFATTEANVLLLKILSEINDTYAAHLQSTSKKLRQSSSRVEKIKNRDIVQFVNAENILYDFNSALVRLQVVYNSFLNRRILQLNEDEHDLIEDLSLETNQLIQITSENLRTMVNIREAYSTIMTNNLNRVIKLFTALTVILTIPTIIGTFYGMNVHLPLEHSPLAVYILFGTMIILSLGTLYIFFRKDWL